MMIRIKIITYKSKMMIRIKIVSSFKGRKTSKLQYVDSEECIKNDIENLVSTFCQEEKETGLNIELKKLHEKTDQEKAEFLEKHKNDKKN